MSPTTLVIFGVSGDLAARKVLPALYWLTAAKKLPENFHIIGVARREVTPEGLIKIIGDHVENAEDAALRRLEAMIQIVQMDSKEPGGYSKLTNVLDEIEQGDEKAVRLMHFAIPPTVAMPVMEALSKVGLIKGKITTRLLLEKPFGFDLASAEELENDLGKAASGDQIYRVDHYLAKNDVQDLLRLHFDNPTLKPLWNSEYIERIEIEASEDMGIEGRSDFYEQTGALRDVIQSHLLALMSLTLMTSPEDETPAAFCAERANVIAAIQPINPEKMDEQARRGQYDTYRREVENNDSLTETYVRLELYVDTDRWREMPIILMGGKGVAKKRTEIRIYFKEGEQEHYAPLTVEIGSGDADKLDRLPDGYERVLVDAIAGNQINTTSGAEVVASWQLLTPVVRRWERDSEGLVVYPFGADVSQIF